MPIFFNHSNFGNLVISVYYRFLHKIRLNIDSASGKTKPRSGDWVKDRMQSYPINRIPQNQSNAESGLNILDAKHLNNNC